MLGRAPLGPIYVLRAQNFNYKKVMIMECLICKEEFRKGDDVITHDSNETGETTNHFYHRDCLREWYKNKENCPSCRDEIEWDDWIPVLIQ